MSSEKNLERLASKKRGEVKISEELNNNEIKEIESYLNGLNLLTEDEIKDFIKGLTQRQALELLQTVHMKNNQCSLVVLDDKGAKAETNVRISQDTRKDKARYLVNMDTSKSGGVGQVLYGYDLKMRRRVGIKRIHLDNVDVTQTERLGLEARVQANNESNSIVKVYDLLTFKNSADLQGFGMVMQFMNPTDSPTLAEWVSENNSFDTGYEINGLKALPSEEIKKLLADVVKVISFLDQKDIHHFDIKPENIFHIESGEYVITDFGLANSVIDPRLSFGTPLYISPEKALANDPGVQADLYSLTLSIYVLMLRKHLAKGKDDIETLDLRFRDQDAKIQDYELLKKYCHDQNLDLFEVERFFIKALKLDPRKRFSSPEAYLVAALKAFTKIKKHKNDNRVRIPKKPDLSTNQQEKTIVDRPEEITMADSPEATKRTSRLKNILRKFFNFN